MNDDLPVLDELERRLLAACYGPGPDAHLLRGHRQRTGWAAAAVAGACAVALVIVLLVSRSVVPGQAQAALERAAVAAAHSSPAPLAAGRYWYTRIILIERMPLVSLPRGGGAAPFRGAPTLQTRERDETWIGVDGTVRERTATLSQRFASPADAKRWRASGMLPPPSSSDTISGGDGWFPPQSGSQGDIGDGLFSYRQLLSLPTSAPRLRIALERAQAALSQREARGLRMQIQPGTGVGRMQIYSYGSSETPVEAQSRTDFLLISELLTAPVTPAVRAALYRTAATLPSVRYDGRVRDPLGRPGIAVSIGDGANSLRMIFQPATGALLAWSDGEYLTEALSAQGVTSSLSTWPAGVTPSGSHIPTPAMVAILPRHGGPHTTFSVTLTPARPRTRGTEATVATVTGPTGPGCRSYLFPPPFVQLRDGTTTMLGGTAGESYRLAPASIGRTAWCPGRYQLQITESTANSPSVFFDVGR